MNKDKTLELSLSLIGLNYNQWLKVKMTVDTAFDKKRKEYEGQLTLDSEKEIEDAIRSRFG